MTSAVLYKNGYVIFKKWTVTDINGEFKQQMWEVVEMAVFLM
jgi:hypothetical protein